MYRNAPPLFKVKPLATGAVLILWLSLGTVAIVLWIPDVSRPPLTGTPASLRNSTDTAPLSVQSIVVTLPVQH